MSQEDQLPTGTMTNPDDSFGLPDLGRLREWRQQIQEGAGEEPSQPQQSWLRRQWWRLREAANLQRETALVITDPGERRGLVPETVIVLGVSLGVSAIRSILMLIDIMTRQRLASTTVYINNSVTPDRPWLDVMNQLANIAITLAPVVLALYLLATIRRPAAGPLHVMGLSLGNLKRDLALGSIMAAGVGLPGLALYAVARAIGINATIAAGNLAAHWWTIPMYILLAAMNGILEEVIMIGYLFTRWTQRGMHPWLVIAISAVIRGSYHLYQGFGAFIGNVIMGAIFGWIYMRTKRVAPLVIAHTLLDVISFVGYSLLASHWAWLGGHVVTYVATQIVR